MYFRINRFNVIFDHSEPGCQKLLIYIIDVDIIDATEDARCIDRGSRCVFRGWDPEGDALLRLGVRKAVVFSQDMDKLSLE